MSRPVTALDCAVLGDLFGSEEPSDYLGLPVAAAVASRVAAMAAS